MSIQKVIWFFSQAGPLDILGPLLLPLGIGFFLYQINYVFVFATALYRYVRDAPLPRLPEGQRLPVLATVPSLLRRRDELEAIRAAIVSLLDNEYPGPLTIAACVDGTSDAPDLVRELRDWAATLELPETQRVLVAGHEDRRGKGVAIDTGVSLVARLVDEGVIPAGHAPKVFFNVDADSELSTHALEVMVHTLSRPSKLTGEPAMVVTSHVAVPMKHYWKGWRHFFSMPGLLALSVAREYIVSLGLGRHNSRLLPHTGASGALYCTWFEIVHAAPRYARFMYDLKYRDFAKWWLGFAPPSFEAMRDRTDPLPEGVAGMGDDTWMTWLAMAVRWDRGRISFEFPRTPLHALWYALRSYFARPFRYDVRAKIYTSTPTTVSSLFKQRMRWNVSRIWTVQRWMPALVYAWPIGLPAFFDVVLVTFFHVAIVIGLVITPFTKAPAMWFALIVLVELAYFSERALSTLLALFVDRSMKRNWRLLLALPTAGLYHFTFNIATTIVGFFRMVLGFGYRSGFAPEKTLILGRVGRIALLYRVKRALGLLVRSVVKGDVPLGWFWFGWHETKWTKNGYAGWDGPTEPARPTPPQEPPPVAAEPVPVPVRAGIHPPMAVPAVERRGRSGAARY